VSELAVTLLRLGYLVLLWMFVLATVGVLRRDLYGTRIVRRLRRSPGGAAVVATKQAPTDTDRPAPIPKRDTSGPRRLAVTGGPLRGTTLPLGSTAVLIGRAPSNTLVLDDDYSSSRHARVYPDGGQWYVEDLGSTNGTFVGRDRVTGPTPVRPGTQIRIGQTTIELQR